MFRSWRLGRFFGIDVLIHWSFWLLPVLHIVQTRAFSVKTAGFSVAFTLLLFTCVLLHEYGHALTARLFGINTRDIILTPLGGIARLERMTEKPLEEILIAVAGPMVNLIIAMGLLPILLFTGPGSIAPETLAIASWQHLLLNIFLGNLALVVFNMAPAFPMDGGRVFRAFLAFFVDRLTATRIAVGVGMGVAGLMALGVFAGAYMMLLIAVFVMLAGQFELSMLKRQYQLAEARRAELEEMEELPAAVLAPPEPDFSGYSWDAATGAWILWRNGWPIRKYGLRH